MLMMNDRRLNADTFWFTLFHEIGHIINGDLGITFDGKNCHAEKLNCTYHLTSLPGSYRLYFISE